MLKVKLLSHTPNAEDVVAGAAKLCYSPVGIEEIIEKQNEESRDKFIGHLASIEHHSPLEHANFTFAIEGVSRSLTHQLVRHRIASYSQQSQRYVKENKFEYIIPPAIKANKRAETMYIAQMEMAQETYDNLVTELILDKIFSHEKYEDWYDKLAEFESVGDDYDVKKIYDTLLSLDNERKQKYIQIFKEEYPSEYSKIEKSVIEDARYVFPNAVESKIVVTMNARTLLHFFKLRSCSRAQWEIRELSDQMLTLVYEVAPAIFSKAGPGCVWGNCPEGKMSCGVPRKFEDIVGK